MDRALIGTDGIAGDEKLQSMRGVLSFFLTGKLGSIAVSGIGTFEFYLCASFYDSM